MWQAREQRSLKPHTAGGNLLTLANESDLIRWKIGMIFSCI
jgi:hypothetical protein